MDFPIFRILYTKAATLYIAALIVLPGCASHKTGPAPVTEILFPQAGDVSFDKLKEEWTVSLEMPNPILAKLETDRILPGSLTKGRIRVEATLYGDELLQSLMDNMCHELTDEECQARRDAYIEKHNPEKDFRIEIVMESDFSKLSLDPAIWTLYITDQDGIMYEPSEVVADSTVSKTQMIYSQFHKTKFRKEELKRTLNLYFPRITFFGKKLMREEGFSLTLNFSYNGEILARAKWAFRKKGRV